jgi:hypothetical protein
VTDFDEFAGIALAIFLALTLLIPHLDGADVIDPASRRQPTQGPTDGLRSFKADPTDHTLLLPSTAVSASKSSSHTWSKKNLPAPSLGSHVILNLKRHERWRHHGRGN